MQRVRCRDCGLGGHRDAEGVYHGDRDVEPCPKSSDDFHHWEPVTIVLDFDGVLHAYTSGWTGPKPTDPPVDGALAFVRELSDRGFELVVVSSRAETKQGCAAITDWLIEHGFPPVRVTYEKVQGDAYIDDRAVPFRGDFDDLRVDLDRLLAHPKWWVPRPESDGPASDVVIARWISNPHRPNGPARSSAKDLLRELAEAGFEVRRTHTTPEEGRECAGGCGLAAAPGDIYCQGCRDGVERERPYAESDR